MKKVIAVITALILIFSLSAVAFAADNQPIIIWSVSDFMRIGSNLGADYILARDIDMSGVTDFEAIGSEETPFTGSLDGNGHAIKNLDVRTYCDVNNNETPKTISLFGVVSGGTIKNLKMTNIYLLSEVRGYPTSDNSVDALTSGIAGVIRNGSLIENCSVSGTVAAIGYSFCFSRASGIAIATDSTIRNCSVDALVFGAADAANTMTGGISAWNENSTISGCCFSGRLYSANSYGYTYAGGIAASGGGNINNCAVLCSRLETEGGTTSDGIPTTDIITAFGNIRNCVVSQTASTFLPNKSASVISDEAVTDEASYSKLGWDFENTWTMGGQYPVLRNISTSEYITENDGVITVSYNDTVMKYYDGILSVGGTDAVVNPLEKTTPIADFADEVKVIIIGENIPTVDAHAFDGFKNAEILIVNGACNISQYALSDCDALTTVYFKGTPTISENTFPTEMNADVFAGSTENYSENLPSGSRLHTVRYENGQAIISGELDIDAYLFFDLCSVICSSFDNVSEIVIEKFICNNLQFFRYDKNSGFTEPIWDHTLTNACIRVKIPDGDDWSQISWNEFCDLGLSDEVDTFRLAVTSDEYEEIEDAEIEIKDENDEPSFFQRILKFITSLLNRLFKIFSKG